MIYQFYKQKEGSFERVFVLPEGATLRTGAIKEVYPDFEDYLENYCGYSYDEDHKAYGYWHNPNAKWDCIKLVVVGLAILNLKMVGMDLMESQV